MSFAHPDTPDRNVHSHLELLQQPLLEMDSENNVTQHQSYCEHVKNWRM